VISAWKGPWLHRKTFEDAMYMVAASVRNRKNH